MASSTVRARKRRKDGGTNAWAVLLLAGLMAAGCERDPTGRDGTLSAREFVEIIVALRTAEREVEREVRADSVELEYERRKAEILDRHDATEADLHEFLERHHARPGVVSTVWDSIAQRLRIQPEELTEPPAPDGSW